MKLVLSKRIVVFVLLHRVGRGLDSCPCIAPPDLMKFVEKDCLIFDGISSDGQSKRHCFPPDYGMSSCKAWDATAHPLCVAGETQETSPGGVADVWVPGAQPMEETKYNDFCSQSWCWVDPQNCDLRFFPTTLFGVKCDDDCNSHSAAYYSYDACGGDILAWKNSLARQKHLDAFFQYEKFRIFMPDYPPYVQSCKLSVATTSSCQDEHSSCPSWANIPDSCSASSMQTLCPESCGTCQPVEFTSGGCHSDEGGGVMGKTGYAAVLFDIILQRLQATPEMGQPTTRMYYPNGTLEIRGTKKAIVLEPTPLDPKTKSVNGTWMGCAVDAGLDRIDLCISAFWDTPSKREVASLTKTVLNDFYRLIATFSVKQYGIEDAVFIFNPISYEVWGMMAAVTLLVGPLMYLIEESFEDQTGEEDEGGDFTGTDTTCVNGSCFGIWHAMVSALGAAPTFSPPRSWIARWLMLGYSFFVMVFVAGYTANMTNYLRAPLQMETIQSVEELISEGKTACVWSGGSIDAMKSKYPDATEDNLMENDKVMESFSFDSNTDTSECHAVITADADASSLINKPNADGVMEHCGKHGVGPALLPINVVWIVNPRLLHVAQALSFFISDLETQAKAVPIQSKFFKGAGCSDLQKKMAAQSELAADEEESSSCGIEEVEDEDTKSLDHTDLAGLFIIMAAIFIITYATWAVKKFKDRAVKHLKKTPGKDFGRNASETCLKHMEALHGDVETRALEVLEKMDIVQRVEKVLTGTLCQAELPAQVQGTEELDTGLNGCNGRGLDPHVSASSSGLNGSRKILPKDLQAFKESLTSRKAMLSQLSARAMAIEESQATLRDLACSHIVNTEQSEHRWRSPPTVAWEPVKPPIIPPPGSPPEMYTADPARVSSSLLTETKSTPMERTKSNETVK